MAPQANQSRSKSTHLSSITVASSLGLKVLGINDKIAHPKMTQS